MTEPNTPPNHDVSRRFPGLFSTGAAAALRYMEISESWLPFVDTYRTMCRSPEPEFKRVLEDVRDMRLAA
jgi:hypothetical protein